MELLKSRDKKGKKARVLAGIVVQSDLISIVLLCNAVETIDEEVGDLIEELEEGSLGKI